MQSAQIKNSRLTQPCGDNEIHPMFDRLVAEARVSRYHSASLPFLQKAD